MTLHLHSCRREDVSAAEVAELAKRIDRAGSVYVRDSFDENDKRLLTVREQDLIVRALKAFG